MKTKLNKTLTVITAITFAAALTLNIQASLSDPFAGMSDEALALTSTDEETTLNCPGGSCTYTNSFNETCTACCPEGKSPECGTFGCKCTVDW